MKARLLKAIPLIFAFFIGLMASSVAFGANETKDKLKLKVEGYLVKVVVDEKGKREELQPLPKKVYPGDVIEYKIVAVNTTNGELKNVIIRARIPKGTSYVPKSATGDPEFSIDNGKTFSKEPVKYYVIENGKRVEKIATPDMYTNIRWKIDVLKPNETAEFHYRVRVKP